MHQCILLQSVFRLVCVGGAAWAQLGAFVVTEQSMPILASPDSLFSSAAAGVSHTCGILSGANASIQCWGRGDIGQLATSNWPLPQIGLKSPSSNESVYGLTGAISITSGWHHSCALTSNGLVYCWGFNQYGQCGVTSMNRITAPVLVSFLLPEKIQSISAGGFHTCAIISDGSVKVRAVVIREI